LVDAAGAAPPAEFWVLIVISRILSVQSSGDSGCIRAFLGDQRARRRMREAPPRMRRVRRRIREITT